jgi:cupin 2 domain-containing protein
MRLQTGNLFDIDARRDADERVDILLTGQRLNVERIVSMGHASPAGFWYDDPRAEWVALLAGAAALEFEGEAGLHEMQPGDYVLIEPHCRHRVAWTRDDAPTVWLAIYHEP